jgi:hypothetical protein
MPLNEYGIEVRRFISMFIDGHASALGVAFPGARLPFSVWSTGDRFVAVAAGNRAFVDSAFPFITSIDGRSLTDWLNASSAFVPRGSAQWIRRNALRQLEYVDYMRPILGLAISDSVVVTAPTPAG